MKRFTIFFIAILWIMAFASTASASKLSDAEYKRMLKACPEFAAADKRMNAAWKALGQAADAEKMKEYKVWQQNWSNETRQKNVAGMMASKDMDRIPPGVVKGGKVDKDQAFAVVTGDRAVFLEELANQEKDPNYLPAFIGSIRWGRNPVGGYLAYLPQSGWTELLLCYAFVDIPAVAEIKEMLENSTDGVVQNVTVKGRLTSELGFEWYEDTPDVSKFRAFIEEEIHEGEDEGDASGGNRSQLEPNLAYAEEYELQSDPGEYASTDEAAKLVFDFAKENENIPGEYSDDTKYTMTLIDLDTIEDEECYVYRLDVDEKTGTVGAAYGYAYQSGNVYMEGQGGQFVPIGKVKDAPGVSDAEGEGPDAWVKGLWLKPTGLPRDAKGEDYSDGDNEHPWISYGFAYGEDYDGPGVSVGVGRSPQSEDAVQLKFLKLDKSVLRNIIGSDSFWEGPDSKKLKFVNAMDYSEKFEAYSYPCQIAIYSDSDIGESCMDLFMQTDEYMFRVSVMWQEGYKKFTADDAVTILAGLKMVEQ